MIFVYCLDTYYTEVLLDPKHSLNEKKLLIFSLPPDITNDTILVYVAILDSCS